MGGDPINHSDPTGNVEVQVKYHTFNVLGHEVSHTYVVIQGKNLKGDSVTAVYRAGPTNAEPHDKGAAIASPTLANAIGDGFGPLKGDKGATAAAIERDPDDQGRRFGGAGDAAPPSQTVLKNNAPTDAYTSKMDNYTAGVNKAQTAYTSKMNSNSFTQGAVRTVTGKAWVPRDDQPNPQGYETPAPAAN